MTWMQDSRNSDYANLTALEVGYVHSVFETMKDWHFFISERWPLIKLAHIRAVLPEEDRERLREWDRFLARFDA